MVHTHSASLPTSPVARPRPAAATPWLLAAVFVLPMLVAYGLFWSGWRPGRFVNHGELLQPAPTLPAGGLVAADGQPIPTSALLGKWLLVLPIAGSCDERCMRQLHQMQQVHIALNKEQERVQRVLIERANRESAGEASPGDLSQRYPGLRVAMEAGDGAWSQALAGDEATIFIVDPMGNVILRYRSPADMRGVLKDLERLLRYSWIR